MLKMKIMVQHVQDSLEDFSLSELSQTQHSPKPLTVFFQHINQAVTVIRRSSTRWSKPHHTPPYPMEMSNLLAGRYIKDVSRHSSPPGEPETRLPPGQPTASSVDDPAFSDARANLFARLGIRTEVTNASVEDIERLIASLSHIEAHERISAAHAIADLYEKLPSEKQMHARINLILMIWRDANMYARIAAVKALGKTKMPDVVEALQVALRDEEQDVRAAAAGALGCIRGKMSISALVAAAIRENEHWSVRAAAIRAMGASGEHVFLNTINLALEAEDSSVRIAAIHALAQLEGLQAAPRLAFIAQRDGQLQVKHAAILELENLRAEA